MAMGVATELGPFAVFVCLWAAMMAAMMLPPATPAVVRRAERAGVRMVPWFVGSYLAVWTLVGVAVYLVYRPHSSTVAGLAAIAAGANELTPVKRHFRRLCREHMGSGLTFGMCCVGSSTGLMALLVALSPMSLVLMVVIAVIVFVQKMLPARAAIDVPVAVAIGALGVLILLTPSTIPGLVAGM
jgi:predicted metal-binding membrane protein